MSPEIRFYAFSSVMNAARLVEEDKSNKLIQASADKNYAEAKILAGFLADENFIRDLEASAIKYSQEFNAALTEAGVDLDLDIEFPFPVVHPQTEPQPRQIEETVSHSESLSLQVLYALTEPNQDGSGFKYERSEIYTELEENKSKVNNTISAVIKQQGDRIRLWSATKGNATMKDFVAENRFSKRDVRDFYSRVADLYGDYTPDEFINIVLKREDLNEK